MDHPADDSLQAGPEGEQDPADNRTIVRRIEITIERATTTVILRRRNQPPDLLFTQTASVGEGSDTDL